MFDVASTGKPDQGNATLGNILENKQTVLLIDFSALFRRAWHIVSEQSHAFESTIAGVNRAIGMTENCLVSICCDGKGNWRKELSKEYKAQRESQPAQMYGEMERTLDRLRCDGHLIWKFDGFEADDVISSAVMLATIRGHWCRIVSHDKDLLQLLGTWCDYIAIHKSPWEIVGADVVREKYGVDPDQFADWLALVGDSSDNVKGCPGVGAKTATTLLQKHGKLDTLFAAAVSGDAGLAPNVQKNLIMYRDQIVTARKLVSLSREVPIKFDEIYETREIEPIDERDAMSEAEQDAEKYFADSTKGATAVINKPVVTNEEPAQRNNIAGIPTDELDKSSAPALVRRDKTPEEVAEVCAQETTVMPIVEYTRQLEPRTFKDAVIAAEILFNSRVYSRYPTKQSMVAAIVRGREMGYGLGASLDMFHVADFNRDGNLRLMMHAHLIIEQAMRDPSVEYFQLVSSSATECTYEAKVRRNAKSTTLTYTIEDAKTAGLVGLTQNGKPNNWMKRPAELLRKTCGVQLGRIVAPGATMGLYCMEEMGIDD